MIRSASDQNSVNASPPRSYQASLIPLQALFLAFTWRTQARTPRRTLSSRGEISSLAASVSTLPLRLGLGCPSNACRTHRVFLFKAVVCARVVSTFLLLLHSVFQVMPADNNSTLLRHSRPGCFCTTRNWALPLNGP